MDVGAGHRDGSGSRSGWYLMYGYVRSAKDTGRDMKEYGGAVICCNPAVFLIVMSF